MTPETPEEALQRLAAPLKRLKESGFADEEAWDEIEAALEAEQNNKENDGEEPDASVPAPLLPRTPVLAGGNARRLEEAVEQSEEERLTP